jgi:hypothetical protein
MVWLPVRPSNPDMLTNASSRLLKAALACPTGTDQDLIDSMSQAFIFIRKRRMLYLTGEEPTEVPMTWEDFYKLEDELRGPYPNI